MPDARFPPPPRGKQRTADTKTVWTFASKKRILFRWLDHANRDDGGALVTEFAEPRHHGPLASSMSGSRVPLASINLTEELRHRSSRLPEFEKENKALAALVSALANPRVRSARTHRFGHRTMAAQEADDLGARH